MDTATGRGKVLVVDDDRDMLATMERMLSVYGFEVKSEASAQAALDSFRAAPDTFEVILTDINMPEFDGIRLMREIRSIDQDAVVIAHTGYASAENAIATLRSGAVNLLEKPCFGEEMTLALDRAVELRRLRRSVENYKKHLEDMLEVRTRDLKEALRKLDLSYMKTLEVIVALLELKEPDTAQHSLRVGRRTELLASLMGVKDRAELEVIRRGGTLHDIGKIGIPDAILNKPAKLDEEEMKFMRRHPKIGYDIVATIPEMAGAAEIVLSHHEHFDGKGYPRGLKGNEICFGARLFSVIDSYDAIRFDRCYRKGSPREAALAEILAHAGTQFDPEVVEAFKQHILEIDAC